MWPSNADDLMAAWAAAVVICNGVLVDEHVRTGVATAPYIPGLLALRVGPLIEEVASMLSPTPDVLLVDGTGPDHPRRAGLALQLGAELDVPTVGVTHRPRFWPRASGPVMSAVPSASSASVTTWSGAGCARVQECVRWRSIPAGESPRRRQSTWSSGRRHGTGRRSRSAWLARLLEQRVLAPPPEGVDMPGNARRSSGAGREAPGR